MRMVTQLNLGRRLATLAVMAFSLQATASCGRALAEGPDNLRMTPYVRAVQKAGPAVVSINGEKTISSSDPYSAAQTTRHVNGMGTGVIVDQRGYILTNHHVVDEVNDIRVTLADGKNYLGRVIASDRDVDLAILKINTPQDLPVIPLGTSSDLLIAEPVIAVGNAFGYEQTVTAGMISALHRSVQVSDAQSYTDLIQTSASINPGNSGGPLLNIHGEMIGVNVAVRAGAQSIAFAIPVDRVLDVATRLMSVKSLEHNWHGVSGRTASGGGLMVDSVDSGSPAAQAGIKAGDVITAAASQSVARPLDLERALLGHKAGENIDLTVKRGGASLDIRLALARVGTLPVSNQTVKTDDAWNLFGLRLSPIPSPQFRQLSTYYRGGLSITDVRPGGPAYKEGIRQGDVLVGIHKWETVSLDNVEYVLKRPDLGELNPVKFWVLRGDKLFYGLVTVASHTAP